MKTAKRVFTLAVVMAASSVAAPFAQAELNYALDRPFSSEFDGSQVMDELSAMLVTERNFAAVSIEDSSGSVVWIEQANTGARANKAAVIQKGTTASQAGIRQRGEGNTAVTEQAYGSHNLAWIEQDGLGHSGYIVQHGSHNTAVLKQCALGADLGCEGASPAGDISIEQYNDGNVAALYGTGAQDYNVIQNGGDQLVIIHNMSRAIQVKQ